MLTYECKCVIIVVEELTKYSKCGIIHLYKPQIITLHRRYDDEAFY